MKKRTIFATVAGVLMVGLIAGIKLIGPTSLSPDGAGGPTAAKPLVTGNNPSPVPKSYRKWLLPEPRAAVTTPPPPPQFVQVPGAEGQPTSQGVKIQPGQVLATVNQIPITVAELIPVQDGQADVTMGAAEYDARLGRAVEAEVTLQAARRQGVGLQPMQQDRIAAIAQRYADAFTRYQEQGVTWSSVAPEQIALEERQMAAAVLQQNLVMKLAGVAPSPDPAMQAKYEASLRAMLDQLTAGASITKAASYR
jgi:hypothetical protein